MPFRIIVCFVNPRNTPNPDPTILYAPGTAQIINIRCDIPTIIQFPQGLHRFMIPTNKDGGDGCHPRRTRTSSTATATTTTTAIIFTERSEFLILWWDTTRQVIQFIPDGLKITTTDQ